jgi:hypothetical protein
MKKIKPYWAISRLNVELKTNVSETSSVFLMMETELVFETLVFDSTLTRLIAREDFIT